MGSIDRISRFVHRLLQRHAIPHRSTYGSLRFVLHKSNPTVIVQRNHRGGDIWFAPRWQFITWQERAKRLEGESKRIPPPLPFVAEQLVLRKCSQPERTVWTQRIVRQMLGRCERVEAWPQSPERQLNRGIPAQREVEVPVQDETERGGPAAIVVRFTTDRNYGNSAAAELRPTRLEEAAMPSPRSNIRSRPAEPAIDLHRLTDHVIQVIDRRIVAQRERTGRV